MSDDIFFDKLDMVPKYPELITGKTDSTYRVQLNREKGSLPLVEKSHDTYKEKITHVTCTRFRSEMAGVLLTKGPASIVKCHCTIYAIS